MKKIVVLFSLVLALVSCESDDIYSEHTVFSDLVWQKTNQPKFTFEITKEENYEIDLEFRLIDGYPYQNIRINMLLSDENGNKVQQLINLEVQKEEGIYEGEVMGDFIDIEKTLIQDTTLSKGKYTIVLEQMMEANALAFINEVGIVVEECSEEN